MSRSSAKRRERIAELKGCEAPRIFTPPLRELTAETSLGFMMIDFAAEVLGIDALDAKHDRAMICGSPSMLADFRAILDARGFNASPRIGTAGEYVFERAFVEK